MTQMRSRHRSVYRRTHRTPGELDHGSAGASIDRMPRLLVRNRWIHPQTEKKGHATLNLHGSGEIIGGLRSAPRILPKHVAQYRMSTFPSTPGAGDASEKPAGRQRPKP